MKTNLKEKENQFKKLLKDVDLSPGEEMEFDLGDKRHVKVLIFPFVKRKGRMIGLKKHFGVWKDNRSSDQIIKDIRSARKNSSDFTWDKI